MGKNNNAKKLKNRLLSSDPGAANRLNNIRLNNSRIRELVATEVTGHYDLSHDLDAFDVAMQIGLDKNPGDYFDDLDDIQIGDLKIEGDDVMFLEDEEDCAYESLLDSIIEDDYDFAEDMATVVAKESSLDIPVFEFDEDDYASEASDARQEAEDEVYEMLLEEDELDDDIDLDDLDPDLDDDDDDFDEPSEEELVDMEDDDLLDPSMDELL